MLCPKCKTEVSEKTLRCANCGVKVRSKCPSCGSLNKVNALNCVNCATELLRKCSACGSYNLPTAQVCRKCSTSLVEKIEIIETIVDSEIEVQETVSADNVDAVENASKVTSKSETLEMEEAGIEEKPFSEQEVSVELENEEKEQQEVKSLVVNSLMNSECNFCAVIAPEGYGKTHILEFIKQDINAANISVWSLEATPVTQLSPFGVFQDLFLSATGMPNYFVEGQQKESDFIKMLEQIFGLTSDDASILFNFLFPSKTSYYEEILHNKEKTKSLIKKIFVNESSKGESILTIDDFDLIDASSFELLADMHKEGILGDNFKLLVTAQTQRNIDGFLQLAQMSAEQCDKFFIGKLSREYSVELIKNILNGFNPFSDELLDIIVNASNGSPAYLGQVLLYMNESGYFNFDGTTLTCLVDKDSFEPPVDLASIIHKRLEKLKAEIPDAYRALIYSAMLGVKFNLTMLQAVLGVDKAGLDEIIQYFESIAFIQPLKDDWAKFTTFVSWKYLFDYVKQDELFAQCSGEMLLTIEKLRLTNIAYKALMAQNSKNSDRAFELWTQVMKLSSYIGDVNLYVLAQKQCLKLNLELTLQNKLTIDSNIKLRLGKLLCSTEPELSLDFLTTILSLDLEKNDITNFVDVSSHAVIAANRIGNYNAVIEIVDNVVKMLTPPEKYKLEIALINTRKIKTMFNLGSYEQLVNVIENDINPHLEDALSQNYTVYNLPISKIFETWIETNLVLADSLILQGNNKVYDVIASLEEAIAAHVEQLPKYKLALSFTKAFAATMKGEIAEAERLIETVAAVQAEEQLEVDLICRLNLLQVLIRFMKKDFSNMKNYLYEAVTFANNVGDYLGKNLLKSALARLLENEGDFTKAAEIYNDQITYFAKEKIAVGALLTWYLMADLCLKWSDSDKALLIATNALDVAKNPKINSFYYQVMFKRLIAEVYLIKGDFAAAKMYLDKSLLITKKFNLEYLNIQLYDFYAKYHIEMFESGKESGSSSLIAAKKLYEKAITLASRLGLLNIVEDLKKEYQSLLTFAQLKKVALT